MTSIFVAKLDFNTTDEQLKSLFEEHGKVNRVTIAKDRETGKPRGFAFVEMPNEGEADAAISALDESEVNGRTIAVKKADDRGSKPTSGESRPERPARTSDERVPFAKPDDSVRTPFVPEELSTLKPERKKEGFGKKVADKEKPKTHKMEAYKKSGKSPKFFEEDDDLDWELNNRNRESAWDDEEE